MAPLSSAVPGGGAFTRRTLLRSAFVLPLAAAGGSALAAAAYPSRPITLVLALAAGGAGDLVSRRIGQKMTEHMHQPVVIENRPGAGAAAAAVMVKGARPDGYTMLLTGNGIAISAVLFNRLPYNAEKDFRPVSTLAFFDLALITGPQSPFTSVKDVLAYAKANPGKLSIGCTRIGSTQHLAAEMLKGMASFEAVTVPYKSTGELLTAVHNNDVQLAMEIVPPVLGQITGKQVKALAVAGEKRFPGLPEVPTIAESGVPGFEATSWAGISVPAATPDAIVQALNKEILLAVSSPDVQKDLQAVGYVVRGSTPQEMERRTQGDMAKWKAVIERAGVPKQ